MTALQEQFRTHPLPLGILGAENKKLLWKLNFKSWIGGLLSEGRLNSCKGDICLHTHYCFCLIVATFKVEQNFSTFNKKS